MKIKLVRVTTVPSQILLQLKGQPAYMKKLGFDVSLVCSYEESNNEVIKTETGIAVFNIHYTRTISLINDFISLIKTYFYFKKEKPHVVHTHSPKAGLIGMLAAKMAGVPVRMHTVAGLPLMEVVGLKRQILNNVERLTSWSASQVYPNSKALMEFMKKERLANPSKLKVIGNGSTNGIDTKYFHKNICKVSHLEKLKLELGIVDGDVVFIYVGRIVKDKGIRELMHSFRKLSDIYSNSKLIIVGSEESEVHGLICSETREIIETNKNVIHVGWQRDIRPYLALSNIFVFPSYREGFPGVVMQAGSMGLPSIVSDINGNNEIIQDGINGVLVAVKNTVALYEKMSLLLDNKILRRQLSYTARNMIQERFEQQYVWSELHKEYLNLLSDSGLIM